MSGRSARMIYVGNLPGDVREWEVEDLFYKEMEDVNIAVQRKGKSVGGCYYKEYEFFPRKDCGSSRGGSGSVAVGTAAEASVAAASNFLDLSLKLSF